MAQSSIKTSFVRYSTTILALVLLLHHTTATTIAQHTDSDVSTFDCPIDCTCYTIESSPRHTYNHANCTSLVGLRQLGKTSTIQSLDCSSIGITKITTQLDKLTNLMKLDLSNNHLSEISILNRRIKELNLSHNSITSGKLSKIPQYVQHLDLSYNEITYLPLEFKNLKNLKSIELFENPINCTCETLQVRNWLTAIHVWTNNLVICSGPLQFKGKPWLQVKERDICPPTDNEPNLLPSIWDDSENDLMLGDQPIIDDSGETADEDEMEKDFLPIEANDTVNTKNSTSEENDEDYDGSGDESSDIPANYNIRIPAYEGSGTEDDKTDIASQAVTEETEEEEEEDEEEEDGSGSGDGMLFIPHIKSRFDEGEPASTTQENSAEDKYDDFTTITPFPLNIFGNGVHRFNDDVTPDPDTSDGSIDEEVIVPVSVSSSTGEKIQAMPDGKIGNGQVSESNVGVGDAKTSETSESRSTYILLGILGVLLLGLIAFVLFRKKGTDKRRNRRNSTDVESPPGTEMADMNKELLGKPVNKNGNGNVEIVPLMPIKDKWDAPSKQANGNGRADPKDLRKAEEPLLQKLNAPESHSAAPAVIPPPSNESTKPMHNGNVSDDGSSEANNNVRPDAVPSAGDNLPSAPPLPEPAAEQPAIHLNNNDVNAGDDEVFMPISPKPSRYSPVYSPETGRVKIKLTETAKPKTPMLVTRSRSNAGDIITTPVRSPRQ